MSDQQWNPWKLTAIGMALVIVTALVTGLVVAGRNWSDNPPTPASEPVKAIGPRPQAQRVAAPPAPARVPTTADVEACNLQAKNQTGDKTLAVVKDAVIGGAVGAGMGAAGGAIAGGGKGAGKGAGVGAVVGAAAGTLYGLNENKSHDARYVEAYRACMRGKGFTG